MNIIIKKISLNFIFIQDLRVFIQYIEYFLSSFFIVKFVIRTSLIINSNNINLKNLKKHPRNINLSMVA